MYKQIDTTEVNRRADLLALAGSVTHLEKVASTGGGEYAGPCPLPGCSCKTDGFRVQPNQQPHGLWMCHNCTNSKWKDPIDLARRLWPTLGFRELCERLTGGSLPTGAQSYRAPAPIPAAAPPVEDWQAQSMGFVESCERELWAPGGARALEYLHKRGLRDETIRRFRLGLHPKDEQVNGNYTDKGITIPCIVRGRLWYVKIRRPSGQPKYRCIKGSHPAAVFNAEALESSKMALFVEGEFDCMLAWQEIGDLVPVATVGSSTNKPDLASWGRYFIGLDTTLILPDNDSAGEKGAAIVAEYSRFPVIVGLSDNSKDLTDFYLAGGSVRGWLEPYLDQYDPVQVTDSFPLLTAARNEMGAVVWEIPSGARIFAGDREIRE